MKVGMLHTGKSGPELQHTLRGAFGDLATLVVTGALDGLDMDDIGSLAPRGDEPRIVTELGDGYTAVVERDALGRRLQTGVEALTAQGASLIILLCTGEFPGLISRVPVVFPGAILQALVASILPAGGRLGVLVPIETQVGSATERWARQGHNVTTVVASPFGDPALLDPAADRLSEARPALVVMDCFAYTRSHRERVHMRIDTLILLPQELTFSLAFQLVS
jgi:protein AroM